MILIHHVRHPLTNLPYIGTVVACEKDGKIRTGFAQCSPKDHYNRRIGRNIALERMRGGGGPSCAVPFIRFRPDGSKERIDVIGAAVRYIRAQVEARFIAQLADTPERHPDLHNLVADFAAAQMADTIRGDRSPDQILSDPDGFGGSDLGGRARGGPVEPL